MEEDLSILNNYKSINECIVCSSNELTEVLELNDAPLTDNYETDKKNSLRKRLYPINLLLCEKCKHLQLKHHVGPEESYASYIYQSAITTGLSSEFNKYADEIIRYFGKKKVNLLDIGSNDGSFLKSCEKKGIKAIGIEPAKELADRSIKEGNTVVNDYFGKGSAEKLEQIGYNNMFEVITFNNVLANISKPLEALVEAKKLLKDRDSVIIIQTGYHPEQFQKGLFDYIYHEHYSYFSRASIERLAELAGLNLANETVLKDLRGGSIRWVLKENSEWKSDSSKTERFTEADEFNGLEALIKCSKTYLAKRMDELNQQGYNIIGYGASHSTGILVHHFELIDKLEWIVDENKSKYNRYMPGTTLQVREVSYDDKSAFIILAWQYYNQIRDKLREKGFKGPIVKPVLP